MFAVVLADPGAAARIGVVEMIRVQHRLHLLARLHAVDEVLVDVDLDLERLHVDQRADAGARAGAAGRQRRDHLADLRVLDRDHAGERRAHHHVVDQAPLHRDAALGHADVLLGALQARLQRIDRGLGVVDGRVADQLALVQLARPIADLPFSSAALIWFAGSLGLLFVLSVILAETVSGGHVGAPKGGPGTGTTLTIFLLLLAWPPVLYNLEKGQWSIIVALLLAFGLITLAIALLIAPSAFHRITHHATQSVQSGFTWVLDIALLLLGLAIGIDLYVVGDQIIGGPAGPIFGIGFCLVAFFFWCGLELMHLTKRSRPHASPAHSDKSTVGDRIDYVLTEARVVLPGVQALLGFQLIVILTEAFANLPASSAYVHLAALAAIAISAVLLIAPAAHHRIVFGGGEVEAFLPIASAYLLAATVFLALGMAADCYVIVTKVLSSMTAGAIAAAGTVLVCLGLWHAVPLIARKTKVPGVVEGARQSR